MIREYDVPSLWEWFFGSEGVPGATRGTPSALWGFFLTTVVLLLLALVFGFLLSSVRYGPRRAWSKIMRGLRQGFFDLVLMSPRRIASLTYLSFREALQRHIWVGLVVFLVVLMFAGWALNPDSEDPAKLYLSFVVTAASYLLILTSLFLSALSLPNDIKNRTIYTVVTKPVRASEIVLGRILGFTIIGTMMLVIMGTASYVFVGRMAGHTHELSSEDLVPVREGRRVISEQGKTAVANSHTHAITVDHDAFRPGFAIRLGSEKGFVVSQTTAVGKEAGLKVGDRLTSIDDESVSAMSLAEARKRLRGKAGSKVRVAVAPASGGESKPLELLRTDATVYSERNKGHHHIVRGRAHDGEVQYEVSEPEEMFLARVPVYGSLKFRSPHGEIGDSSTWKYNPRGIKVGDIFQYQSYIEGNSLHAAIWSFKDIQADDFPNGLPVDLKLAVFRSHKGEVDKGIQGSLIVRNPKTEVQSRERFFTVQENKLDRIDIARSQVDSKGAPLDLFKDLVDDQGNVEIWIRCIDSGQTLGMAPADLYIRAPDGSYTWNFIKRHIQVWLKLVLVISLGVLFSTFLSGPIALLLAVTMIFLGHFTNFLHNLSESVIYRWEIGILDYFRRQKPELIGKDGFLNKDGFKVLNKLVENDVQPFVHSSAETMQAMHDLGVDQIGHMDRVYGGGPIEATYRLLTQNNQLSKLPEGFGTDAVHFVDHYLMVVVQKMTNLIPDFERIGKDDYLAHGYDIQNSLIAQQCFSTLGFVFAALVAGYFFLKTREVAR